MIRSLCLMVVFFSVSPVMAADILLSSPVEQGALVYGKAPVGATVTLGKKELLTSEDGRFVFGIGRDETDEIKLRLKTQDGKETTQIFPIKKREWKIQRIDGLPPSKVTPPKEVYARIQEENGQIATARTLYEKTTLFPSKFKAPAKGRVSGVFGSQRILNGKPKSPHSGMDIAAPKGAPVHAAADGVVSLVHQDMYYSGKTVMLSHGYGVSSIYIHLSDISVKKGDAVKQGEKIGAVGKTGRATGAHLHWGVSWGQKKLDPEAAISQKNAF